MKIVCILKLWQFQFVFTFISCDRRISAHCTCGREVSSHSHINMLLITPERRRGSASPVLPNLPYDVLLADKVQLLRKWRFTSAGGILLAGRGNGTVDVLS
jgi:hypothetical protein